ncbi:MAG: hypothetical protein RMM98_07540 [Acidobacteriota bacterium]|nr:hypothetical protein [Blastocatellia bacterium]MDW8239452.1 hypothetical protein [Acidobacteriota bacterium]
MDVAHSKWCPSIEQLADFVRNLLSTREAAFIRQHLQQGCATCNAQVSQLQQVWSQVDHWMLRDVPEWLMRRAVSLFDQHRIGAPVDRSNVALLVADSFDRDMLLGFRSTRKMSRQLLYRTTEYDIDLCIHFSEREPRMLITGQANPVSGDLESVVGGEVELYQQTELVARTFANEFGWFYLDESPEGVYNLLIRLKSGEIAIHGLDATDPIN